MTDENRKSSGNNPGRDRENHQQLYHWIYSFGFCILFSLVDVWFFWPENHLGALLTLAGAFGLTEIYEMRVFGIRWIFVSIAVIITFIAAIGTYAVVGPVHPPERQVTELLEPGEGPAPPNGCDNSPIPIPPNSIKLLIGDNALVKSGMGRLTAIKIGQCEALGVERKPDGVGFSFGIYDDAGKMIAKVDNNKIDALTNEHNSLSRDGDLSTIRINNNGIEVFYAHYWNKDTLQVRGIFRCPGSRPLRVEDDKPIPGFIMHRMCVVDSQVGFQLW